MVRHVHLGSGRLGLGLPVWIGSLAGFAVVLANRSAASRSRDRNQILQAQREYDIVDPNGDAKTVRIDDFLFIDDPNDRDDFIAKVADPRTLLLTTALGDGIWGTEVQRLLSEAIKARLERDTDSRLFVIACENETDSLTLRRGIERTLQTPERITKNDTVEFCSCIVDRVCTEVAVNPSNDRVEVLAEDYAKWIIEEPTGNWGELQRYLANAPGDSIVEFVRDIDQARERKLWLVNGPHLLIAIHAWAHGYAQLDDFLHQEPGASLLLRHLLSEAALIFTSVEPSAGSEATMSFCQEIYRRFREHPDRVARVLHRFSGAGRLEGFFASFYTKVGDPLLRFVELEGNIPRWTGTTAILAMELVRDGRYVALS